MLKPGKAPGMDGLVPKFLIGTAYVYYVICKSLALIFQNSMLSRMVPRTGRRPMLQQSFNPLTAK